MVGASCTWKPAPLPLSPTAAQPNPPSPPSHGCSVSLVVQEGHAVHVFLAGAQGGQVRAELRAARARCGEPFFLERAPLRAPHRVRAASAACGAVGVVLPEEARKTRWVRRTLQQDQFILHPSRAAPRAAADAAERHAYGHVLVGSDGEGTLVLQRRRDGGASSVDVARRGGRAARISPVRIAPTRGRRLL